MFPINTMWWFMEFEYEMYIDRRMCSINRAVGLDSLWDLLSMKCYFAIIVQICSMFSSLIGVVVIQGWRGPGWHRGWAGRDHRQSRGLGQSTVSPNMQVAWRHVMTRRCIFTCRKIGKGVLFLSTLTQTYTCKEASGSVNLS